MQYFTLFYLTTANRMLPLLPHTESVWFHWSSTKKYYQIWENTDGCAEQYRCAYALYLLSVMSQCYSIYEYHGGEREEQGSPIGVYKSAFLVDLVASYLFEKAKPIFRPKIYHGIYQDDGPVVFKGKKKVSEIKYWLEEFQQTVNPAEGNQHLKSTTEIWTDGANPPTP